MIQLFFCIGEYGPLLFVIFLLLCSCGSPSVYYITFAVLLEWSLIGLLWKYVFLSYGSVRPKYKGEFCTMHTTGFPSAHSGAMVVAVCLVLLIPVKHRQVFIYILLILAPIVIYQRVYFDYHSKTQILAGIMLGLLSSCVLYTIYTYIIHPIPMEIL